MKNLMVYISPQKEFDEVGGRDRNHLLKISVAGVYSYREDKYYCFTEDKIYRLGEMLLEADQVIGFNIKRFDFEVLKPYVNYDIHTLPYLDILEEVEKLLGHRVKLDSLAQSTLGIGKSGDGLQALKLYKAGRIEELKKYCIDDVKITKELYDYVLSYGKLLLKDYFETKEIKISFNEPESREPLQRQTSLF